MTLTEQTKSRLWLALLVLLVVFESSCSRVQLPENVPGIDKIGHFFLYGLLATHLHRSGLSGGKLWLGVLMVSLFGITDEWHQSFVPGRSAGWQDWVSDTAGAALAIWAHERLPLYRRLVDFTLFRA